MADKSEMPEKISAWPFSGWKGAGGQWGGAPASMPGAVHYVRIDVFEALEAENARLHELLDREICDLCGEKIAYAALAKQEAGE